jgi:thiol peroxidase
MAEILFKGNPVHTTGKLPAVGSNAGDFKLTTTNLSDISLKDFAGKKVVLNIFPSIDTGTCAASVRRFNKELAAVENTVVLCVSKDLPFAHKRFCEAEGIENVVCTSVMRDDSFTKSYPVTFTDGPLAGLLSRSVVVIDEKGVVKHAEQVSETTQEPNYEAALKAL